MSGDLPVEEPGRGLSEGDGPRDSHVFERLWSGWDGYFAVVWAGTLAFVLGAESGAPSAVRIGACCLLALLVPWYVAAGRPLMHTERADDRAGLRYLVPVVAVFSAVAWAAPEGRLATFGLVPQCFMLLSRRRALQCAAAVSIVPVAGWAAVWRPEPSVLYANAVSGMVTLVFSLMTGSWILRVIEQSRDRAALIAELDANREEIARLSAERGALAERERMSREIHDTLAQGFTSLLMLVQAVESELEHDRPGARRHLALMEQTARENLAEARALVAGRAPADLDDGGSLPDALGRLAARHHAAFAVTGRARELPPWIEVVALRSCQEALSNVRKHAGPDAGAEVRLGYDEEALTLEVRDFGRGFDPSAPHEGYGLRGLRARAAEVHGTVEVTGRPGEGTRVTVRLPVPCSVRPAEAPRRAAPPQPPPSPAPLVQNNRPAPLSRSAE
ncbi:sensor histidine kinase [Streptomyces indicus]|uniref:Signal transduction histidine kinase n=1 Tax=Streptomyces indicus TaxID=417292 RepID=A0A1G8XEF3_9ACTN|nr:sensor histidine kinase [Streptomyces indicus]SDJ88948.1 Signal transduction histidine kinase [Streptomyces indicus]